MKTARKRSAQGCGFTLVEMAIVLVIIAVLVAILTPIVASYVDQARIAKAQDDTRALAEAISRFERDVGRYPMYNPATGFLDDSSANVFRLDGAGASPTDNTGTYWAAASTMSSGMDDCGTTGSCSILATANVLMANIPLYTTNASLAKPFKWKGPYIDVQADPWGNKYLVNIIHCKPSSTFACFVLSAGPNGAVDTQFDISNTSTVTPGGDDILYRIK
jgi:prepilin-type N-terminal cleavage/methylation domain-containing protein